MTADEAQQLTAHPVRALDVLLPSRPPRTMRRAPGSAIVLVETTNFRPQIADRVDLRERDAAERLARYALV